MRYESLPKVKNELFSLKFVKMLFKFDKSALWHVNNYGTSLDISINIMSLISDPSDVVETAETVLFSV